jgi:adenylate cyclase, class 2
MESSSPATNHGPSFYTGRRIHNNDSGLPDVRQAMFVVRDMGYHSGMSSRCTQNGQGSPSRNVELKARLPSLEAARVIADQIATARLGVQYQIDTYFACRHGRLKLRQIDAQHAQLVWYARPDETGPKASDYRLVPVANPETLKQALAAAWDILVVVEKRREIFLHHNVRIHLDDVRGLGTFLEFEAVLGGDMDTADGEAQVRSLAERFVLQPTDLLACSYSDLLMRAANY